MELIFFLSILNLFPFSHPPPPSLFLCLFFLIKGNTEEAGRLLGSKNVRVNCLDEVQRNCTSIMLGLARKILGLKAFLLLSNIAIQTPGNQSYSEDTSSLQLNDEPLKCSYFFKESLKIHVT